MLNWIDVLKTETDKSSQAAVARVLGYSPAAINQVIKGTYKGDSSRIEQTVRATFMHETVLCPVLSEIPKKKCFEEQAKPFAATNRQRVELFKACRNCPNNRKNGGAS